VRSSLKKALGTTLARSFAYLDAHRGRSSPPASVMIGQAGQVNVDCAVMNEAGR
jgi:hypothetical protein